LKDALPESENISTLAGLLGNMQAAVKSIELKNLGAAAVLFVCIASAVLVAWEPGHAFQPFSWRPAHVAALILGALSAVLGFFSLFGFIAYFAFVPSFSMASQIFSQAHCARMIHPFLFALLIGLISLCLYTGSVMGFVGAGLAMALYALHTYYLVDRTLRESGDLEQVTPKNAFFIIMNLLLGGELVTYAAGAKPISAWNLDTLPQDTWVIDVRTKPEFHWNRLNIAENYPWGAGVVEAATSKAKDKPVLVTCFSGHRSPSTAAVLTRLGFTRVYNLNWGIIYAMMTQSRKDPNGPFSLTRANRDPHRRGEDLTLITRSHVTLIFAILTLGPLLHFHSGAEVSLAQLLAGALLGLLGLLMAVASYRALGRNFRVYAAPRRSGTLVTSGIYSKVRHPMYTGVVLGLAGYVLIWGAHYLWPLWLACSGLYFIKGFKEDKILEEKFPEYRDYIKRTKRFAPYLF
jgi:protein-S-isoprenylcysteine O-methyltransferase Ste14